MGRHGRGRGGGVGCGWGFGRGSPFGGGGGVFDNGLDRQRHVHAGSSGCNGNFPTVAGGVGRHNRRTTQGRDVRVCVQLRHHTDTRGTSERQRDFHVFVPGVGQLKGAASGGGVNGGDQFQLFVDGFSRGGGGCGGSQATFGVCHVALGNARALLHLSMQTLGSFVLLESLILPSLEMIGVGCNAGNAIGVCKVFVISSNVVNVVCPSGHFNKIQYK